MTEIAAGDSSALGQLYLRHNGAVRAMIRYVAPKMSRHDVDDVTQEVFLSLGKSARLYRHRSLFNAFLFRIATNRTRDWQRRSWLRFQFFKVDEQQAAQPALIDSENTPSKQTMLSRTIRQVLQSLSYEHREVLVLRVIQGFTCDEIAVILKIRPKTVRTRLHRARSAVMEHSHASVWKDVLSENTP
ncbi:MAG: RNA polymerase sigma factor [Deltaproteobacteria bacterium]|nr:RNA polymerase sigma factor [Deltaproteobacteria bacterium]MBN2670680.1 RNA polymerase sigma factor [Deltaproteobacteria bacterium]